MNKRIKLAQAGLICALGITLNGCGHFGIGQSKPTYGPVPEIAKEQQRGQATVLWKDGSLSKIKQYAKLAPVVEGDRLYAADHKGHLIALDKNTGHRLWEQQTKQPISAGPKIVGDMLLVGTGKGKVIAYDKHNGQRRWLTSVSSEVLAPPNGNTDLVLVKTVDGKLTALNANTGEIRWIYDRIPPALILRRSSTPEVVGDVALAGFSNGKFIALSKDSGVVVWEHQIAAPKGRSELQRMVDIAIDPIIEKDTVYIASVKGNVTALNVSTGDELWENNIPVYQNMVNGAHALYLTDAKNNVIALDKRTGAVLWRQDKLEKRPLTSPAMTKGYVVVGDKLGMLYWLDRETGKLVGSRKVNRDLMSDLIISDNKLYLQGKNGTLAAIEILPK